MIRTRRKEVRRVAGVTSMCKTSHIQKRMSQRGIRQKIIDMVISFGETKGDKRILNKNGCRAVMAELDAVRQTVMQAMERGGYVVVDVEGKLLTTYALDSYNPHLR